MMDFKKFLFFYYYCVYLNKLLNGHKPSHDEFFDTHPHDD